MKIPLARPHFSEEEIREIRKVLDSRWVSQGPAVEKFEKNFGKYIGTKHAIAVNSATSALHIALLAAGVKQGDEVIVPDFTFPATGNAVHYIGAKPVIADIDADTYNLTPENFRRAITPRTKAVIPVHTFGNPCEMDEINEIAEEHGIKVIEDAACAHGSKYNGKMIGTFGDTACFSFHARKGITTGEGGMVTTDDDKMAEACRALRSHGTSASVHKRGFHLPSFDMLGFNYRMSDILAAVGIAQLRRISKYIKRRRQLAAAYDKALEGVLEPQEETPKGFHVRQAYVARVPDGKRDAVIEGLAKKGVQSTIGTYSLSSLPLFDGDCPVGRETFKDTIALPLFYEMTGKQLGFVVKSVKSLL
jgi:dTDP-4-amino-4,6-dideoxygalactose transaminase